MIYSAGIEDTSIVSGAPAITVRTTAGAFDAAFARCAISVRGGSGRILMAPFEPLTSVWLGFKIWWNRSLTVAGAGIIGFVAGPTGNGLVIGVYNDNYCNKLQLRTNSGTILATEAGTSFGSASGVSILHQVDIHITGLDTSLTTVQVYWNKSVEVISWTGDLSGICTYLDRVRLFVCADTDGYDALSEIVVADEDTRELRVKTLVPNGAGDTNAWTGGYAEIDELTRSDADGAYSNADGATLTTNLSGMPSGTYRVKGLRLEAWALRTADAVPSGISIGIKDSGVIYDGSTQPVSEVGAPYSQLFPAHPATGANFTAAQIEAIQLALTAEVI